MRLSYPINIYRQRAALSNPNDLPMSRDEQLAPLVHILGCVLGDIKKADRYAPWLQNDQRAF